MTSNKTIQYFYNGRAFVAKHLLCGWVWPIPVLFQFSQVGLASWEEGFHGFAHHETPWWWSSARRSGSHRSTWASPVLLSSPSHFYHLFRSSAAVLPSVQGFFNLFRRWPAAAPCTPRSPPVLAPGRPSLSLFNDAERKWPGVKKNYQFSNSDWLKLFTH